MFWGLFNYFKYKQDSNSMTNGIDVSHHNGVINWKTVATSNTPKIDFAIMKSSEGASGRDRMFTTNVNGCVLNGIKWSAYHFATWNKKPVERDAEEEANWFLATVRLTGKRPDLPLVLDVETNNPIPYSKSEMVSYIKTFTDVIKKAGYEVAIYASPGFLNSYLPSNHPFTNIPLWVADCTGAINPIPGWTKYWMHQYTEKGKVNGVPTLTDLNKVL